MSSNNEQHHGSSKPNPRRSGERAKPPRQVDHTYHDFAHYPIDDLPPLSLAPTNFPTKLHHILSDPEYHHVSETLLFITNNFIVELSHLPSFSTTSNPLTLDHLMDGEFNQ